MKMTPIHGNIAGLVANASILAKNASIANWDIKKK